MSSAPALGLQSRAQTPPQGHRRRLDIEGLRAVAVLAVVFDHLIHWPGGGFIGVDMFFVISGYLISGILLREATTRGRISFREFYLRRFKRILPAAALVLSVTVTAAYVIFYAGRASSIATDAFWALVFSANWRFALLGTDYMNSGSSVSPIQHYWSLGVEEQFYIFWPWVIIGALFLARRLKCNPRGTAVVLGFFVAVPILLSFAFALWETNSNHTVAYFSTFSRGWELGAGALLAVLTARFSGFPQKLQIGLLSFGLLLIGASLILITPETPFPAPFAIFPVLGTCLVILAGCGGTGPSYNRLAWILTNPASRYVGKISYSLYLWHFPVIILLGAFVEPDTLWFYLVAVTLMTVLSVASFKWVEDPIRRSRLGAKPSLKTGQRPRPVRRREVQGLAAFAALVLALPLIAFATIGQRDASDLGAGSSADPGTPVTAMTADQRQEQLRAALASSEWPALRPNPAEMGPDGALAKPDEWIKDGCLGGELSPLAHDKDVTANALRCVYGPENATRSLVIFGDSTTMSFVPGIRKALEGQDWQVHIYTVAACSPVLIPGRNDASADECKRFKLWVQDQIGRLNPDVVASSFLRNDGQLSSGAVGREADAEWQKYVTDMGRYVVGQGARYVLLEAPAPAKAEPSQCITRFSVPSDCITERSTIFDGQSEVEARAIADVGINATFVPTKEWFCVNSRCPAFVGSTAMYADINHISALASEELAPLLRPALAP